MAASLQALRRRKQEVSGKVGGGIFSLDSGNPQYPQAPSQQRGQEDMYNQQQQAQQQYSQAAPPPFLSQPQETSFAGGQQQYSNMPPAEAVPQISVSSSQAQWSVGAGPISPPDFGSNRIQAVANSTDAYGYASNSPPRQNWGNGQQPFLGAPQQGYAPPQQQVAPRDIRSAGHITTVGLRGPMEDTNQSQSFAPLQPFPAGQVEPMYGRRAKTTEIVGRDRAKDQRQLEYQIEIQKQADEARERKRLEKERQKKEDAELEARVQQDRQRLADKERQEREKEIREREEKEAAALGGGRKRDKNQSSASVPQVSDHKKELQQQIEERQRRKAQEEEQKRLEDEKYERKFQMQQQGAAAHGQHPPANPGIPSSYSPNPAMSNVSAPQNGFASGQQGYPDSQSLPWETPNVGSSAQFAGGDLRHNPQQQVGDLSRQPYFNGNNNNNAAPAVGYFQQYAAAPPSNAALPPPQQQPTIKDEIFSMLLEQQRLRSMQQQQLQFPPSVPQYYGGSNNNVYGAVGSSGLYSGGITGSSSTFLSHPYPPSQNLSANPSFGGIPSYGPPAYGGGGGGNYGQQQQQQQSAQILQRFMDEDLAKLQSAPPRDDVSLELPSSEPTKFVRRR